jgi:hypothetical protein
MFETLATKLLDVVDSTQQTMYQAFTGTLSDYFDAQDEIRVYVTNTNGFGHQVSTVNIMLRLIGYGYKKDITCIYDDRGGDIATISKLAILLPQIVLKTDEPPDPITINGATIAFQPVSTYAPGTTVDFGITGGYDDGTNLSTTYKTNYFIVLQPFQWNKAVQGNSIFKGADRINLLKIASLGGAQFGNRGFYMNNPTLSDAEWDLYMDDPAIGLRCEYANYIHAFALGDDPSEKKMNLCSAYGMTDVYGGLKTLVTTPSSLLFNLTTSILYAQTTDAGSFNTRTLLLVMADVSDDSYEELGKYLKGEDIENDDVVSYLTTNDVANRVKILTSLGNEALEKAIDALDDGQVLIVSLPNLPPPIFNQMMYISQIPFVFEGKNTANLAINFKNSYFYLAKQSAGVLYPTLPLGSEGTNPVAAVSQTVTNTMQTMPRFWPASPAEYPAKMLGDFIIQQKTPTDINYPAYFNEVQEFYHNELNDKLFLSLITFIATRA